MGHDNREVMAYIKLSATRLNERLHNSIERQLLDFFVEFEVSFD